MKLKQEEDPGLIGLGLPSCAISAPATSYILAHLESTMVKLSS
jgi:hypothetical protein